jgi:hypothetical protein
MTLSMPMFPTFLNAEATWNSTPSQTLLAHHESIEAQGAAASTSVVDTQARLLDLLGDRGEDDYGPLDPTQHAFLSAFRLARDAQRHMTLRVAGSPSVDSRGGIRVTWRKEGREIRLICPSDRTEEVYIYEQSERRNRVIHGVTAPILAGKLSWLVSGGDIL